MWENIGKGFYTIQNDIDIGKGEYLYWLSILKFKFLAFKQELSLNQKLLKQF